MLQFLLIISLLIISVCPVKLLSFTAKSDRPFSNSLFLKQIDLENENLKIQTIANLSQITEYPNGYLCGTFNGSVIRFIVMKLDSSHSYSIYSVDTRGILDKNRFTISNSTLSHLQQDEDSLFATSIDDKGHRVLVKINLIKQTMSIQFTFVSNDRKMMILRGSTYDTVQHIYYIGYLYQFGRSLISGINTKYFNYTTYSRLPYVINNLMINANGTILFANVYNDDGNHLISIDLHQNKTRRLITYRNTSWMFRASTLGKNNKVFTIMRTIYEEFFFITTDLTTNTYKSIQLDEKSNSIPYSMWEI